MKKNYALFLTGIVALGLIFSLGFTGCENAVGETGPAGPDYFNKIQIVRVDKPATAVVVARAATAAFGVQYYEDGWKDVPDPATVAWKVYGAGQVLGDEKSVVSDDTKITQESTFAYGDRNGYRTLLHVGLDESSSSLFVEASYKGWTHTVEVQVGIPFRPINLKPGETTNIGHSKIDQYDWVGRGDELGKTADATTYLVYETRDEPVPDLTGWDTTPAGVTTYYLNDDILVMAGKYVAFYEVDANDVNKIISYGYDQGYIRARGKSNAKLSHPGDGKEDVTVYSNIRLPTLDELPKLRGFFGNGPSSYRTTHGNYSADWSEGANINPHPKDGTALAAVANAGSKVFDGKVSLVYEGDIFTDYDPGLYIKAIDSYGGYDLATPPSNGKEVKPDAPATPALSKEAIGPLTKTGAHRYVVVHSSGAWMVAETGVPEAKKGDPSEFGVYVNQEDVQTTAITGSDPTAGNNLIEIDAGPGRTFRDTAVANSGNFTLAGGSGTVENWFIGADKYNNGKTSLGEASQKVILVSPNYTATAVTIKGDQFDVGSAPIPTGKGNDLWTVSSGVSAKRVRQYYAQITPAGKKDDSSVVPGWVEGTTFTLDAGGVEMVEYVVKNASFSPILPGTTPPSGGGTGNDKVNIKWYWVTGSEWAEIKETYISDKSPPGSPLSGNTYNLDGAHQWDSPSYKSTFKVDQLAPSSGKDGTGHGINPYGKTVGVIVSSKDAGVVLFVDAQGKKDVNQRIVGVIEE